MNLLKELQRRNVIRMAGLYLVGAWLVTQVAGTVFPMFGAPDWVARSVVIVLAIGFIPALIVSWVFELTPEGLKRDSEVTRSESIAPQTARRMDVLLLVGLVAVVAVVAADRFWPRPAQAPVAAATAPATGAPAPAPDTAPAAGALSTDMLSGAPAQSIAVLPFADLSPVGDQAYFADGISDEILNVLVSVKGLSVASRTSSFQFRSQQSMGIPAIAGALKVRHVLEGSVRRAGDRIRITAQLIDASRDAHLWSETFDRTITTENLFDIQDEIAKAIVAAIDSNLGVQVGAVDSVPQRTGNLDAYALYLKARPRYSARENLPQIAELLGRAVEIDPNFVDAIALRASVAMLSPNYNEPLGGSVAAARELARQLAKQALALQPRHGLALGVLTTLDAQDTTAGMGAHLSVAEVMQGFDAALAADPRHVDLLNWRGRWLAYVGRFADAEADFRLCRTVDPAYAPCRVNQVAVLITLGRRDEARQAIIDTAAEGALVSTHTSNLMLWRALDMREAFYMAGSMDPGLRGWHDFPALYEALGQPNADHSVLRSRLLAVPSLAVDPADTDASETSWLMAALGDPQMTADNTLGWLPTMAHYRQSAAFRTNVIEGGRLRYWQEHGFPPQCKPLGTDDFECE